MSDNEQNQQDPNNLQSKLIFAVAAILIMVMIKFGLGW